MIQEYIPPKHAQDSQLQAAEPVTSAPTVPRTWPHRVWSLVLTYPIPSGTILLLMLSLGLWAGGHT
jgi:hypothetical protein